MEIVTEKRTSKNTTVGWVWPGMPSHSHASQSLSWDPFAWSGHPLTAMKIVENEELIEF